MYNNLLHRCVVVELEKETKLKKKVNKKKIRWKHAGMKKEGPSRGRGVD